MHISANSVFDYQLAVDTHFCATLYEKENRREIRNRTNRRRVASASRLMNRKRCVCCGTMLAREDKDGFALNAGWNISVRYCPACGWWCAEQEGTPTGCIEEFTEEVRREDDDLWNYNFFVGRLREFRVNDITIPVDLLAAHIAKNHDALYSVHPRKFEELIADVFADFFSCEVELTAQTRDGGIDLYLLNGDEPALVQVKRRCRSDTTERVSVIRELAGVLLISGHTRGIVVTTAAKYSSQAEAEARATPLSEKGYSIELITCDRLLQAVAAVVDRRNSFPAWRSILRTPTNI